MIEQASARLCRNFMGFLMWNEHLVSFVLSWAIDGGVCVCIEEVVYVYQWWCSDVEDR